MRILDLVSSGLPPACGVSGGIWKPSPAYASSSLMGPTPGLLQPNASNRSPFSADSITIVPGFEFSVHAGSRAAAIVDLATNANPRASRRMNLNSSWSVHYNGGLQGLRGCRARRRLLVWLTFRLHLAVSNGSIPPAPVRQSPTLSTQGYP